MTTKNRTVGSTLTTSNQDVYTVPPKFKADVDSIFITNVTTSAVTFSLDWYDSTNSAYHTIAETVRLEPNSLLQITKAFYLLQDDKIRGLCSVNNSVEVSVKVSEQFALSNL
jgi:hypothetical protein